MTRLFLLRHGETLANRERRHIGTFEGPLTALGERQAQAIAQRLQGQRFQAIYASPLQRTQQTAAPLAALQRLTVQIEPELRETNFGSWEGLTVEEVRQQDPEIYSSWLGSTSISPPGGESNVQLRERVTTALQRLCAAHPDQTLALVTHVGPIRTIVCAALGLPPVITPRIFFDLATISVVDWDESHPLVRVVNDHGHLVGELAPRWFIDGREIF